MLLITVSMLHTSYNHFNHFLFYHLACIFQEVDNGYNLYVPEGTIIVRDSDLYLYDQNEAVILIKRDLCHRPKWGLDIYKLYAVATESL